VPGPFHLNQGSNWEAIDMRANTGMPGAAEPNSPWPGFFKFLLLVFVMAMMVLLGQAMVRHRFFRGGWVNQRDVLKP
jgi:hypothetical protein